jgi:hypothetical protein
MTELAIRDDGALAVPAPVEDFRDAAFTRLTQWAQSARAAHQVAQSLVKTSFVPEAFRGKPDEATAAILSGAEVGLSPMAALRSFDVIQGTAAPRANTLRAVVQSQGHEIRVIESTSTRAIVEGRRRGESSWQRSTWTIDRAKQLSLTGKKNWQAQPGAMLVARATSEMCRWIGSDAILGIAYSSEELIDDIEATPAPEVKPARRTAQRAPRPAPAALPAEPDSEPDFDDEGAEQPEPITAPQQRKLHALLREKGLDDREAGLTAISGILGRDVESTKELSKQDGMRVIDALDPDEPALDDDETAADRE